MRLDTGAHGTGKTPVMEVAGAEMEVGGESQNGGVGVGAEILVAIDLVNQVVSEIQI